MARKKLIVPLKAGRVPRSVGNKALNLHRLSESGYIIPKTVAIPWDAYQRYLSEDGSLADELRIELTRLIDPQTEYAVRSSANIEDGQDNSFAGQFDSILNTRGVEGVLQAVWKVWETTQSPRVESYLKQHNMDDQELCMGVMVQEMVQAVYSGVAMSRNPVTGADEVIVEAVESSGEFLVQMGVTPERWIHKWGSWIAEPQEENIPRSLIAEIVAETRRIASELNAYVDLEWVYDGKTLYWLQVREITALNRPHVYSNHISKEVIPGIIKPLIGSINIPLVCSTWVQLIQDMFGEMPLKPEDLAKSFYYRVYFNMGTLGQIFQEVGMPADSVETLMGIAPEDAVKPAMKPTLKTWLRLPRMLNFLVRKWFFTRQVNHILLQIEQRFKTFDYNHASELKEAELFDEIDRLYKAVREAAYPNIVVPILSMIYNRILKRLLQKYDLDILQLDLMAGVAERSDYDPNFHLYQLHQEFCQIDPAIQAEINTSSHASFLKLPGISEFQKNVALFLDRFGHLSDHGNDFSYLPWREIPDLVVDMITHFIPMTEESQEKIHFEDLKFDIFKGWFIRIFYQRAREYQLLREKISSIYTYGYGLFRNYYLALGAIFVRQGYIDQPGDIFYLQDTQIRQLGREDHPALDARQVVAAHKADMERFRNIRLPTVIYGNDPPPVSDPKLEKLVGVPTSIGHYTGKVSVVRGIRDFNKVQQGDVLVIPYSEVGWTPLFARASAVVAESGGMLSHSSIVAREYQIPAVVSVAGATNLPDNTLVTVNGHNGEVIIQTKTDSQEQTHESPRSP